MNKHLKFIIKLITITMLVLFPFMLIVIITENIPNQYNNTFLAEFNDKYENLKNEKEKKIIFVGGSSLPFGLRSDLIEEEIPGYKVINFGLYATLGTKFMMDMSKVNISEGDIVILSPELNTQTYSLYFNPEAVLQACDGLSWKYKHLSFSDNMSLIYNYSKFSGKKIDYYFDNTTPNPIGVYRHDSFNSYGDIFVERKNNIMVNGYDSTMNIKTTSELFDSDFIKYVNDYIEYVRSKNAKIYFNFSPCNELSVISSKETRNKFQSELDLKIKCDLLSNIDECVIDYRYFYDTNFHLNSSGAIYYTNLLVNNLKMKLGLKTTTNIDVPLPPEADDTLPVDPDSPTDHVDFDKYDGGANTEFVDYFEYRLVGSSYQITGVKDEYKNMTNVILPSSYNGKNITTICKNAFNGCINLENIYIAKTYKVFEESSFSGCLSLKGIYLYVLDGNTLSPASTNLLEGANKSVKIYIPEGANYSTGYTWSNYSSYFEYFKVGDE